jgi:hypothetical protein
VASLDRSSIEGVLTAALSAPLGEAELEELLARLEVQEEYARVVRAWELRDEEPSLPPSLEERP